MEQTFAIKGTHCPSCKMLIEDILEDMGITPVSFEVDEAKKEGKLTIKTDKNPKEIKSAIEAEGDYTVEQIN